MKKPFGTIVLIVLVGCAAGLVWWFTRPAQAPTELLLYGNVDLRQAQLAFNNSERIAEMKFREGDRVRKGEVLATLETSRLKPMVDQAKAQVAEKFAVYQRLSTGSRPQEREQARQNVKSAEADAENAREKYKRYIKLGAVPLKDQTKPAQAVSKEEIDNVKNALADAEAKLIFSQKALDLAENPRKEDVDEAEARWHGSQAQLALLKQQLADASLRAPDDYVVRTRLMEPGEMATPAKAVYSLAIVKEKWVRAYVSEPDLGKLSKEMKVEVTVDSFRDRIFEGQIGFISSMAEFTPKAVQTEELRTSLVYEVRVNVTDPKGELLLGMPATVHVPLERKDER